MKADVELNNKKKNVNVLGKKVSGKAALSKSPNTDNNLEITKNDFRNHEELIPGKKDVGVIRTCCELFFIVIRETL